MVHKKAKKPKCRICGKGCGCYVPYKDCFFPRKEPRYIKYMVSHTKWNEDLKNYNFHLKRVFDAKCYIDATPPNMNLTYYLQIHRLNKDTERCSEIDRDNKKLLQKIIEINRKGGDTDNINTNAFMNVSQWRKNQLKMIKIDEENKRVHGNLCDAKPYYPKKEQSLEWKRFLKKMKLSAKFPIGIFQKTSLDDVLCSQPTISGNLEKTSERPECFLEFKVDGGEYLGKILVELYRDHVPVTVQNFMELLSGRFELGYKGCPVHRIVKDRYLETGDITKGNGTGGFSIYGESFDEENHSLKHTKAGVLSMVRLGTSEKNNSRFCITFMNMQEWDRKNVVFGKVIHGANVLTKLSSYGRRIGKPLERIYISRCGLLPNCNCLEEHMIKCA
ncbi:uncharacterized protein LOC123315348 [Coccinella septempunctata]|uniref:uncharacterized protein LOC123315348 n=1 Tax=Coccinella septempunctata TaxID=41139 RepID=UPI001D08689C|nr:uncharacterized protein LOC123315348 [Coccinella septempunctata]